MTPTPDFACLLIQARLGCRADRRARSPTPSFLSAPRHDPSARIAIPIVLDCACGMKLRLADELSDKRVRCPVCHATASVPAATPAPSALEDAPLIRIRCGCGKQFDVQA